MKPATGRPRSLRPNCRAPRARIHPHLNRAASEALESRRLLALTVAGPELAVNQFTTGGQSGASVSADAAGNYVVAWTSDGQDGSGTGVYARRYDASGNPLGGEFRVNQLTAGAQHDPSVAVGDDGKFVVVWTAPDGGSSTGVFARRFDASGAALDAQEFIVNADVSRDQSGARVAADADGDFVVVYHQDLPNNSWDVYARRFASTGAPQGEAFLVNTTTAGDQFHPAVAMADAGAFVVAWDGSGTGDADGAFARAYDASGAALGAEVRVNMATALSQSRPAVASAPGGAFVVAFANQTATSSYDAMVRRYDATGAAQGAEVPANATANAAQMFPAVSMDGDGGFVVAWGDDALDGSGTGIAARRFLPGGQAQGAAFVVNTFTTGAQSRPSITASADGDVVVAWTSAAQDGNGDGVFAQRFTYVNEPPTADAGGPYTIAEGQSLALSGSGTDPDQDALTFAWDVNGDGTFGDATGAAPTITWAQLNALGINDGPASFNVKVRTNDGHGNTTTSSNAAVLDVTNVAPRIAVSGNASVNEGSVYTLNLGAITDPGNDAVFRYLINWGDGAVDDVEGNPQNTTRTHTYADGTFTRDIKVSLFDDDALPHADAGTPNPLAITVQNVAPTATFFNGGPVVEGSGGLVGFAGQFDPSGPDTAAGFRYSYDFNNDGDFADSGEHNDVTNTSVGVPAIYLADGNSVRTIRGRIKDRNGGFTDYTTSINVINVAPFVDAGPDINIPASVAISQVGTFNDTQADAPFVGAVDFDWHTGDADAVPLALNNFSYTLKNVYNTPGTYTMRVFVTDKDGATGTDDVTVNVAAAPTLQVSQFLFNASGFTLRFNRAISTPGLNLYDGLFGTTQSSEPADLTLVGNNVGAVRGSLVWSAATNTATFVRTGGPLLPDTYTLTVRSAANAFCDPNGATLDGNGDGTAGDNFVTSFNVTNQFQRTLSIPDFARGPDAGQAINLPNTAALGIPVRIDDGSQVRSVDFTVTYDPALLTISAAELGAGLPGGWSIASNMTSPGSAVITVFGTGSDLPAGPQNLVKLVARVPDDAPYGSAAALRISNITVARNDASTIPTRGDTAVQKVAYFGDTDGDRAYTGFDAGLISRLVVNLDTGFHAFPLSDPVVVADVDGSSLIGGLDASYVAQKAVGLPRPEIPDLPANLPPLVGGGVDPLISAPVNKPARPGAGVTVPISIDQAQGTLGFNFDIAYDTTRLDVADDASGVSPAVTLGALLGGAGGWTMLSNVDDATGKLRIVYYRTSGAPMSTNGGGIIANVDFAVTGAVAHGTAIPIDLSGPESVGGLTFTYGDGSLRIDAVAPSVLANNYRYQTAPHAIAVQFSEDVGASLSSGDFTVVNTTTGATIPSGDFNLTYDAATNTASLAYSANNGVLPDGRYALSVSAADVTDAAGNPLASNASFNFFFLLGDANHDGRVNLSDFNILAANFGQSNRDYTQADFTYDGVVNLRDFNVLAGRFGTALAPNGAIRLGTGNLPSFTPGGGGTPPRGQSRGDDQIPLV